MTGVPTIGVAVFLTGIVAVLGVAIRRQNVPAVVNALASLAVTLLPPAIDALGGPLLAREATVGPALPLWIGAAGFLHSLGMLGPYDSVPWWDTLTHTLSAALVAALVYAGLLVVAPAEPVGVLTVAFTLVVGVFWELIELLARRVGDRYDVEPVLVHYGWRDTALDLVFDGVGALLVVLADVRAFVPLAEQAPRATRALMVTGGAVAVGGSVLLALALTVNRAVRSQPG